MFIGYTVIRLQCKSRVCQVGDKTACISIAIDSVTLVHILHTSQEKVHRDSFH